MLKTKAIRKIFTTTLTMFIILTIFTIPTTTKEKNILRTNLEIEDVTNLSSDKVYLLNSDELLVRVEAFIAGNDKENKIKNIIEYLTISNNKVPSGLKGYIPEKTKLLNFNLDENVVTLNFSKDFLNHQKDDRKLIITGLVYSILEIDNIESVIIQVADKYLDDYKYPLDKNIGINNKYLLNSRKDLNRVVVYYLNNINDKNYFVPITKYLNDKRDKIEVIIDELKNNNDSKNLISYVNNNLELVNYKEESDVLFLNFNDYLLDGNDEINKSILNSIAYSVFSNYDVNMVMFEVNNQKVNHISRKDM